MSSSCTRWNIPITWPMAPTTAPPPAMTSTPRKSSIPSGRKTIIATSATFTGGIIIVTCNRKSRMARLLIAMLVSICVLPALADSCRDRARKGGKMETVAAQQVSFDAKIAQATEDVLTVEYSLVNHAAADIYVMDTLPAWDPDAKKVVPVDRPYICYR